MKLLPVDDPAAGHEQAARMRSQIEARREELNPELDVHLTPPRDHALEIVKNDNHPHECLELFAR